MNKSYVSADTILETNTDPRPVYIPNAIAGYVADLIINLAKKKANDAKNANDVDKKASG